MMNWPVPEQCLLLHHSRYHSEQGEGVVLRERTAATDDQKVLAYIYALYMSDNTCDTSDICDTSDTCGDVMVY